MAGASWVAATNGALLEVSFEDVGSAERIVAQHTHVGAISGVYNDGQLALRLVTSEPLTP